MLYNDYPVYGIVATISPVVAEDEK